MLSIWPLRKLPTSLSVQIVFFSYQYGFVTKETRAQLYVLKPDLSNFYFYKETYSNLMFTRLTFFKPRPLCDIFF